MKKCYSRVLKLNQHKCLYVIPLLQHNVTLNKYRKTWNSVAFCLSSYRKLGRKLMYLHKISIMNFLHISTTNHRLVYENIKKSLHQVNNEEYFCNHSTPPLWTDLVKISSRKPRHTSSFSLECTNFKSVIFEEKNSWVPFEISTFQGKRWGMPQLSRRNFH